MPSESDLRKFAQHVTYEIEMLLATDVLLLRSEARRQLKAEFNSTAHNALLESHTVHVRNLYAFFFEKRRWKEDAIAADYVQGWEAVRPVASPELALAPDKVEIEIVHLSYGRLRGKTSWVFWKLTAELIGVIEQWLRQAPDYFQDVVPYLLRRHSTHRAPFRLS